MSFTYKAFVSYSHAEDSKLAAAIHTALHRFAKPWYKLRAMRVFHDKTSMSANPALWPAIERALGQSEWLLYFACPAAAQSPWVQKELQWWLEHRSVAHLILCVTGGDLKWDGASNDFEWHGTTALSSAMRGAFQHEPLWVDLRQIKQATPLSLRNAPFRDVLLDIAAPLHGKAKDVLYSDDLLEQRKLKVVGAAALSVILLLSYGVYRVDQISRERKDTITSHELAGKAYLNLPNDPELSALLALAGLARRQTGLAEVALRHALARLAPATTPLQVAAPANVHGLAFSSDAHTLALLGDDGNVSLLGISSGSDARRLRVTPSKHVTAFAWQAGDSLLGATDSGELLHWQDLNAEARRLPIAGLQGAAPMAADDNGRVVIAALPGGLVGIANLSTPGARTTAFATNQATITALALHRAANLAVTGGDDGSIMLWDLSQQAKLAEFRLEESITALAFNPRGRSVFAEELLAASDSHGNLHVFDVSAQVQGQRAAMPRIQLPTVAGGIAGLAFTGNGKCLAVTGRNGELILKEVNSWNTLRTITSEPATITLSAVGGSKRYALLDDANRVNVHESALCADKNDLCAFAEQQLRRPLTPEERRRFIPGSRASDDEDALPPHCAALVDRLLQGRR